jgi:anion-transporting  ArsA/GET3 family ATPase
MSLREVLEEHRVVVCVGSGGVGKTTTAAALAVHAAMEGRRVLCLTIDPARRLANSLGLHEMQVDEQEIPGSLFQQNGLELRGSLSAMMLDTKRTFDDLVSRHASSPEARERILGNKLYQYVSTSLAGTQEYMAMEKLHDVRQNGEWDLIVLDTPPTSNALDFLDAPERLVGLIDSPAIRWFVQAFQSTGKISLNLVGKGAAFLLRGLAKFTGAEFLDQVAEFVVDLNDLFGGFRERAREVEGALRSPEVAFIVVTSPNPLAVEEAVFIHQRLLDGQMRAAAFVINAIHELLPEPGAKRADLEAEAARLLPAGTDTRRAVERMWRALDDERLRGVADRIEAERLRTMVRGEPQARFVEVPAFEEDVHDLGALARVAHHLVAPAAGAR